MPITILPDWSAAAAPFRHTWEGMVNIDQFRWMVRKDIDRTDALILEDTLYTSLQDWADGLFRSSPIREDLFMHPRDILEYTQGIRYFIGVPEQRAIERFQACLEQLTIS